MYAGIDKEQEQKWSSEFDKDYKERVGLATTPIINEAEGMSMQASGFIGIPYIHQFVNTNGTDCAQAAIATLVAYHGRNIHPSIPRNINDPIDKRQYPDNNAFVNAVFRDYPNDGHFFGLSWTWKEQIAKGLAGYGLKSVQIGYAGAFENGQEQWNEVHNWLKNGWPVVVLIDNDPITHRWGYHYTVLYKFDGTHVHLTNMNHYSRIDWYTFMKAWHCSSAPHPNNFVFIGCAR